MKNLRYESLDAIGKERLVDMLESDDPEIAARALYAGTRWEEDWKWMESQCLRFIGSPTLVVRRAAASCLGDLALMRRPLDIAAVIPALTAAMKDPEIAGIAEDSLSLVSEFLAH